MLRVLRLPFTLCFLLATLMMGCAPQLPYPPPVPPQQMAQLADQVELTSRLHKMTYQAYTLDAGDEIKVRVDGSQPVTREMTVDPEGMITYPHLGKIQVAGLTLPELDRSLGSSLAKYVGKPPRVTTTITKYRNQHVYILGEVQVPGVHPLQPSDSMLDLITQAGGPTEDAGWLALLIKKSDQLPSATVSTNDQHDSRKNSSNGAKQVVPKAIRVDLDELRIGTTATSLRIESGDTIYIPEGGYFYIDGEVERPGQYRLKRGMTAIQAISNAGGYTPYASKKISQSIPLSCAS